MCFILKSLFSKIRYTDQLSKNNFYECLTQEIVKCACIFGSDCRDAAADLLLIKEHLKYPDKHK